MPHFSSLAGSGVFFEGGLPEFIEFELSRLLRFSLSHRITELVIGYRPYCPRVFFLLVFVTLRSWVCPSRSVELPPTLKLFSE